MLDNRTPYAAERTWVRDARGAHWWVVAVKASFTITNAQRLELSTEPCPVRLAPEYRGEDGASSVRYEADLVPMKPSTDILLDGHAYAPGGRAAPEVPVSLRVGELRKVLLARGVNAFYRGPLGLATTAPRPFLRMPITYERAFGGSDLADPDPRRHRMDRRNPVGVGVAAQRAKVVNTPGPNVVYPGRELDATGPAGFGPIASHWSPRAELAGTYDAAWETQQSPLLPTDYDIRHLQCAPADQRWGGHLRGGERIEVVNMSPRGVLRVELPTIELGFTTWFGRHQREHHASLGTVIVEPDESRVVMVWQTQLAVEAHEIDYLDETVIERRR